MSRPKITPSLFAQLVEQAPGRVRKRLDSDPNVANEWTWTSENPLWLIQCNEETVRLRSTDGTKKIVSSLSEVECTCLLSPKCFHVLACCSVLEIQGATIEDLGEHPNESAGLESEKSFGGPEDSGATETEIDETRSVEVSEDSRAVARKAIDSIERLLRVGARNAGLLLQTELLQSSHLCRAAELVNLGNTLISIVEGVRRIRSQSDEGDATTLRDDLIKALWIGNGVCALNPTPAWMIGQARRSFAPVALRKIEGVLAEAVLTRSGYAGVSVLLRDVHRGGYYSINEVRPGDAGLIHQAYLGGIELGGMVVDARSLSRSTFSVQGMTASVDGRLGKGKGTKWGRTKSETDEGQSLGRSSVSLGDQIAALTRWFEVSSDVRPAGWDVLEVTGVIIGVSGDCLVVDLIDAGVWRFSMPMDSPQLEYRHNFELLARCAGLRLRWYLRLRFDAAHTADVLAIRSESEQDRTEEKNDLWLDLPAAWNGLCNLGLDRIERHYAIGIQSQANEMSDHELGKVWEETLKFVQSIERRLVGIALGGVESVPGLGSKTLQRDYSVLKRLGLAYGGVLLEQLSLAAHARQALSPRREQVPSEGNREVATGFAAAYLACAKYIEGFKTSLIVDPLLELAALSGDSMFEP